LTIAAQRAVGDAPPVVGVDASPEMVARATRKAARAACAARFEVADAEALPFVDGTFDVVTSSLMLHHLAASDRAAALREMRRVLKDTGRALVVEFAPEHERPTSMLERLHRHGHVPRDEVHTALQRAGFGVITGGGTGMGGVYFLRALVSNSAPSEQPLTTPTPLAATRLPWLLLGIVALGTHLLGIRVALLAGGAFAGAALLLAVAAHVGLLGTVVFGARRRRPRHPSA
jgi:SAM-dependent methyltransferase